MAENVKQSFNILGFSEEDINKISEKDVVKSFFKLAKELHPDRHHNDKDKSDFTLKFQALNNAYQVVLDHLQSNDTVKANDSNDTEEKDDDIGNTN